MLHLSIRKFVALHSTVFITIALALENAIVESTESGCTVFVVAEDPDLIEQLDALGLPDVIGPQGMVARRIDALNRARAYLDQEADQRVVSLPVRPTAATG